MMNKNVIIAWWSGGITSAVACYWALQTFKNVEVVFLDTKKNEDDDTYRFMKDCEKLYGRPITPLSRKEFKSIQEVWRKYQSLNTAKGAICSTVLKREVREAYQNLDTHWGQVFGFEYDKSQILRHLAMRRNYPEINVISPLIDMKWNKAECKAFFRHQGIEIPVPYKKGYENNNCHKTGCVRGGIGYWQMRERQEPESFLEMAMLEHELTDKKGEPVTICKDQGSDPDEFQPVFLLPHPSYPEIKDIGMMKGIKPKPIPECFGFCATKD